MKKPLRQEKPYKNPTPPEPEDPRVNDPRRGDADDHPGGITTS